MASCPRVDVPAVAHGDKPSSLVISFLQIWLNNRPEIGPNKSKRSCTRTFAAVATHRLVYHAVVIFDPEHYGMWILYHGEPGPLQHAHLEP
eukprot:1082527-Pleurochrysis_carterae.AAC.5